MGTRAVACLVIGLLATSCGSEEGPQTTTLVLGAVFDQASASAYYSWPSAANLALGHLNDGLAEAGASLRFKLILNDTSQDAALAVKRSTDLVRGQRAKAIITDTSRNGIAITKLMYDADATNDIDVPVVCVTCTAAPLNDPNAVGTDQIDTATLRDAENWSFRTCNRGTEQSSVLQRVILTRGDKGDVNRDGKFKVSIMILDDPSGHGFVQSTQSLFMASNPEVIVEKVVLPGPSIDINNAGFWDQIALKLIDGSNDCPQDPTNANGCLPKTMEGAEPDALMENVNPGYNIALSKALTRVRNHVTFFHAHAFRAAQTADILRSAINGQQGVSAVLYDDGPSGMRFASEVRSSLGRAPALLDSSVFDATMIVGLAALKASHGMADPTQVTGAQVRDALGHLNEPNGETIGLGPSEVVKAYQKIMAGAPINYQGASGPVDFDASGNVWVNLALYAGVEGAFTDLQKFDCVRDHACPALPATP
jgi:hypothetical protein